MANETKSVAGRNVHLKVNFNSLPKNAYCLRDIDQPNFHKQTEESINVQIIASLNCLNASIRAAFTGCSTSCGLFCLSEPKCTHRIRDKSLVFIYPEN